MSDAHTPTAGSMSVAICPNPDQAALDEWDHLVCSQPFGDVAQLSAWARIRKLAGYETTYVHVHAGGRLVGGAQVLLRRIRGLGLLGYVPYGPLVSSAAEAPDDVHDEIADALAQLCRRRLRMLFVQPPDGAQRASLALSERGFRKSDADVAPAASLHVDLNQNETVLRAQLSRRLRRWTNTWAERGVTVRLGSEADLPLLADLLAGSAEYQGFMPFDMEYLSAMYRELSPAGHLVAFVGEVAGRPVAMTIFTACGTVLKARLLGLDRSDEGRRLNVVAAVYWNAMRWAKQNGYRWFDLGGVPPASVPALLTGNQDALDALAGPDRYKARFGGQAFYYPTPVEMIPNPALRMGYDAARQTAAGRHLVEWAKLKSRAGDRARSRSGGRTAEPSMKRGTTQ